jgi:hypothetical protein
MPVLRPGRVFREHALHELAFAFLADPDPLFAESARSITGHEHGLITIDIAEADDVARERMRQDLTEPYRSLLGHCRQRPSIDKSQCERH